MVLELSFFRKKKNQYFRGCMSHQLGRLNTYKSVGSDGIHPWLLKELADVVALFCCSPQSLKYHGEWERCLMTGGMPMLLLSSKRQEREPRKLSAIQLHLHPCNDCGKGNSGGRHQEYKKKRRSPGIVSMDSSRGNQAEPIWQPSVMTGQDGSMRREQWICPPWLHEGFACLPWYPCR